MKHYRVGILFHWIGKNLNFQEIQGITNLAKLCFLCHPTGHIVREGNFGVLPLRVWRESNDADTLEIISCDNKYKHLLWNICRFINIFV